MSPHPRTPEQLAASDPGRHVWVSASAGTGKTLVLTDRMLRLMLAGSPPDRILALTFTRAAAAEMQNRLTARLGEWVRLDDGALAAELRALGAEPEPALLGRARALFALALEVPGGLRIQTLHGFAQGLLAAFPVEAGLPPGFTALDERATARLRARALSELIEKAAASGDDGFLDDVAELAVASGENGVRNALATMLRHAEGLLALPAADGIEVAIRRFLGVGADETADGLRDAAFACGGRTDVLVAGFADAMEQWTTATGRDNAAAARAWLAADGTGRMQAYPKLRSLFLSGKGEPKRPAGALKKTPELEAIIEEMAADLLQLDARVAAVELAAHAARHLRVGRQYVGQYARLKRAELAIDYDDMIRVAADLLGAPGMPNWVGWKLDQRIDHILVDEAQDTNGRQWAIIGRLAEEFFAGDSGRPRTLFVVGDYKQAIYGFQGTDPRLFEAERMRVADRAAAAGSPLADVPLGRSFRSGPAVLGLVDAVLARLGPAALGMAAPAPPHVPARADAAGDVTLWPLLSPATEDDSDEPDGAEAAERLMARTLGQQVQEWLTVGHPQRLWLPARGRWATPGDILILVRARSRLMTGIVAALHEGGVPVAGVDRLLLTEPYAVLDLVALMRFAVQPDDDLNLASLLVSPFIGWTHEEVRAIAAPRGASLWRALRAATADDERSGEARAWLAAALAIADLHTPYEFIDTVLSGALGGRRRLVARLGHEANAAIDELLAQALAFETRNPPLIEGFLAWLEAEGSEVKRDPDAAGSEVRLMTVHGAKGLEAPVVVLADAARLPGGVQRRHVGVELTTGMGNVPLVFSSVSQLPVHVKTKYDALRAAEDEEGLRLLYVALTRAADHLFIGGAVGAGSRAEVASGASPTWWSIVGDALETMGCDSEESSLWGGPVRCVRRGDHARTGPHDDLSPAAAVHAQWTEVATGMAPPPGPGTRPLTPSRPDEAPPAGPAPAGLRRAAERGRLIHRLFEQLPAVPAAERRQRATAWGAARGFGDEAAAIAGLVIGVIEDPELAPLFGPEALAEAPVAGVVAGRVIAGTIDRLLVTADKVWMLDFKTGLAVPAAAGAVPVAHLRQMAAYRAVLSRAFPGRAVRAGLLYTAAPRLLWLGDALLDAALPA